MTTILFAVNKGILDVVDNSKIADFKKKWLEYFSSCMPEVETSLNTGAKLSDEQEDELLDCLKTFRDTVFL